VLPEGQDPDDFIRQNGKQTYDRLRGQAEPFLPFALKAATTGRNVANAKQKAEAVEDFLPIISSIRNNVQKRETFDQAMSFFHLEDAGIKRQLWNTISGSAGAAASAAITHRIARAARPKPTVAERRLLALLVHDRELRDTILPIMEPSDYENLANSELFQAFIAIHDAGEEIAPETLMTHIADDEELLNEAQKLLNAPPRRIQGDVMDEVLHEAENCVFTLRSMAIATRILDISREAALAEQSGDTKTATGLAYEQLELEKIRRELQRKIVEL